MSPPLTAAPWVGTRVNMMGEGLLPNGQHALLRSTPSAVEMQRPNRLVVVARSDAGHFRLTHEGRTTALHDLDAAASGAPRGRCSGGHHRERPSGRRCQAVVRWVAIG